MINQIKEMALMLCVSFILCNASLSHAGGGAPAGLSQDQQTQLLDSLRNYEPMQKGKIQKRSQAALDQDHEECKNFSYRRGQKCFELKYMKDGYYLVSIGFLRDKTIPVQPRAPHIPGSVPFARNTAKRDAFLTEWSDPVFRKYIGEDYHKFHSLTLRLISRSVVSIEILVSSADELIEVLADPRIRYVNHVASPEPELEEGR